jgi:hypothetical protein
MLRFYRVSLKHNPIKIGVANYYKEKPAQAGFSFLKFLPNNIHRYTAYTKY